MTDFIDSTHDAEMKAALSRLAPFLPSANDRSKAESLARWPREFSSPQRFFAQQLIDRAQKFAKVGALPASVDDLWDEPGGEGSEPLVLSELDENEKRLVDSGAFIAAIAAYRTRTRTMCSLREATDACAAYARQAKQALPALSAPAPPAQVLEVKADDLEACVRKVLEPGLEGIRAQLDARGQERQDAFNRLAAKSIAEQVLAAALAELEKRKPREVIVRAMNEGVTRTVKGRAHKRLPDVLSAVAAKIPALLVGPAGSGKSTAGEQVAEALGLAFYITGAASGTHEYLGYNDGAGAYHSTPFRQAFEHGGLFVAGELDSGSADIPLILNPAIANGYLSFPDRTEPVRAHKDFRIMADANTYGNGADRVYVGRTQLDGATIDRFAFIDWDYDEELEMNISCDPMWTKRVQAIRKAVAEEKARIIVSPRASINGGILLHQGADRATVENMIIWKGVDKELRRRVEARI